MPSYPIRPIFPIDVPSPSGAVKVGRQGASVNLDINGTGVASTLITPAQFYAALEAFSPGASGTIQAAVPSDPTNATDRAFRLTSFITPGCALLVFIASTLGLTASQVRYLLAQAALRPK